VYVVGECVGVYLGYGLFVYLIDVDVLFLCLCEELVGDVGCGVCVELWVDYYVDDDLVGSVVVYVGLVLCCFGVVMDC